jgi:hypothetical protein
MRCGRCGRNFVVTDDTRPSDVAEDADASQRSTAFNDGPSSHRKQPRIGAGSIDPWITIGVPRDDSDLKRLLEERPHAWEFLLLAAALRSHKESLEPKWVDHEDGIGRVSGWELDELQATYVLSDRLGLLTAMLAQEMRVVDPEAARRAFGGPGEPGDPHRIQSMARHLAAGYEAMLDWSAELRGLRVPDELRPAFELAARMADQPVAQVRAWIDQLVRDVDELPGRVATGEDARVHARLTLSTDPTILPVLKQQIDEWAQARRAAMAEAGRTGATDAERAILSEGVERIELRLRSTVLDRLDGDVQRLPSHVAQKATDRLRSAARRRPGDVRLGRPTLATMLEYTDLRELFDTITAKSLWSEFADLFATKEQLTVRFDQLAELRNSLRHSRTLDAVTLKDGEAAILWFTRALLGVCE